VSMQYAFTTALQQNPKLGHTKPSTGLHAGHGLDIAGLDWYRKSSDIDSLNLVLSKLA